MTTHLQQSEGVSQYNQIFKAGVAGDYVLSIDMGPMQYGDRIRVSSEHKSYTIDTKLVDPFLARFTLQAGESLYMRRLEGPERAWAWKVTLVHAITKPKDQVLTPDPLRVWQRYK